MSSTQKIIESNLIAVVIKSDAAITCYYITRRDIKQNLYTEKRKKNENIDVKRNTTLALSFGKHKKHPCHTFMYTTVLWG